MNCERTAEEMSAYLDGELSEDLARQVEAHLDGCPACAGELRSLRHAATVVTANVPEIELRPEIWYNVHARVANRPASVRGEGLLKLIFGRRWLAVAATAVIALTIGIWGYLRYQDSQEELNQYMSQYIRVRDIQEQMDRSRLDSAALDGTNGDEDRVESARNPFSVVNFSPEENPFRAEDR